MYVRAHQSLHGSLPDTLNSPLTAAPTSDTQAKKYQIFKVPPKQSISPLSDSLLYLLVSQKAGPSKTNCQAVHILDIWA